MPAQQDDFSSIPVWPRLIVMLGIVLLAAGAVIALAIIRDLYQKLRHALVLIPSSLPSLAFEGISLA